MLWEHLFIFNLSIIYVFISLIYEFILYFNHVSSLSFSLSLSLPSIHPYLHLSELFLTTWHGYTLVHGLCVLNKV